ncbi:MAG: ABC transporter substrate-binding protein, partial [Deltaproteobacteria bacterium]|nr:ABC transporter substrate-binding protein [Deltaproteobacteria bacterium]
EVATLKALMERDKGDYSKIEQVSIGSMDFFAATSAEIDFVWIFQGWDGVAAKIKGIDISYIPLREIEPALDYYTPLIVATDKYIEKNPEIVRRFLKALSRGYEFCIENPEKSADILLKNAPELDRKLVEASQKFLARQYKADAPRWGEMKLSTWVNYANWLDKYKQLEGEFEPRSAFTNEFLPE